MGVQKNFYQACIDGDLEKVNYFIKRYYHPNKWFRRIRQFFGYEIDINGLNINEHTPLMLATIWRRTDIVKALIKVGAKDENTRRNGSTYSALLLAIRDNHSPEITETLIAGGIDVNISNWNGMTPLLWATENSHTDIVKTLLARGASLTSTDPTNSVLLIAAKKGDTQIVKALLTYKIDVNKRDLEDNTPLMLAAKNGHTEIVKVLLEAKPNLNIVNKAGDTALILAAQNGHTEIVKAILKANTDLNMANRTGDTALILAAKNGHSEIVRELLWKGANPNCKNTLGHTAISWAVLNKHPDTVTALLSAGADLDLTYSDGNTLLMEATELGQTEIVAALIGAGVTVNSLNQNNVTALSIACENGHTDITLALLAAGAKVNISNTEGNSPLIFSAQNGHTDNVIALLAARANVNIANGDSRTALIYAAQNGHTDIVTALLKVPHINVNATTPELTTALTLSAENGHTGIVMALINAGADVEQDGEIALDSASRNGHHDIVKILLLISLNINASCFDKDSALAFAAFNGHHDIIQTLLTYSANVNASLNNNETALILSAKSGHTDIVSTLLNAGAEINMVSTDGNSALIVAAHNGHIDTVRTLLLAGSDVTLINQNNQTAIIAAFENGRHDIVRLLRQHGAVLPPRYNNNLNYFFRDLIDRQNNLINRAQSVHETSVHVSVSRSAKNLLQQYRCTPEQIKQTINELKAWLQSTFFKSEKLPSEYKAEWLGPAKTSVTRLSTLEFTDERSNVTMQQALAYVWKGINNPKANGEDKPTLSEEEILQRRINFVKILYEIQREYNLSDSANPADNGGTDLETCVSGSFNKLIAALNEVGHKGVNVIFVTKTLIAAKASILTQEAFSTLSDTDKNTYSKAWNGKKSETIQAAFFAQVKPIVAKRLHEIYDEFHEEISDLKKVIQEATDNIVYTDMDKVIEKSKKEIDANQTAAPNEIPASPQPVVFRYEKFNMPNTEKMDIIEPTPLRHNPERVNAFKGRYGA